VKAVTSFFLEMVGSLVPASQVAALEDGELAEVAIARSVEFEDEGLAGVAVARSVEFAPKHFCDILELCLSC